jgi:hypothetical protein
MPEFIPARNKLEVVARISALTNSGPETLGPGSKERKSVVINLANGLGLPIATSETKSRISNEIARFLGREWTSDCESVGETLTLKGLNLLLEAATEKIGKTKSTSVPKEFTLQEEINALTKVLVEKTPRIMDGRSAVIEMKEAEYSKWRETEWQGFYFEFKVIPELINTLGGGPRRIGRTEFDYGLKRTWDMKVHSTVSRGASRYECQLNDATSIDRAVKETGFGIIILNGIPQPDLEFTKWHKEFRGGGVGEPRRLLKKSFAPTEIDIYYFPDEDRLDKAKVDREIKPFHQGHQPTGEARNLKYSLDTRRALGSDLHQTTIPFNLF